MLSCGRGVDTMIRREAENVFSIIMPFGRDIFRLQAIGTPARRAARWGRLWGCAPFAVPLASPPKHPQEGSQLPRGYEGTRLVLRELPSLATLIQVISLRDA